jgi:hypothetical protein
MQAKRPRPAFNVCVKRESEGEESTHLGGFMKTPKQAVVFL